jgi:hypothetical protein
MTYDARHRDAWRRALAGLTGVTTVGALTACGWLAGVAARDHAADTQRKETARQAAQRRAQDEWARRQAAWLAEQARHPQVRTVWKKRPTVTVVDTRVVRAGSVGPGGTLSSSGGGSLASSSSSGGSVRSGSSGYSGGSRPSGGGGGAATSAAPPPAPPPAPTSGS